MEGKCDFIIRKMILEKNSIHAFFLTVLSNLWKYINWY